MKLSDKAWHLSLKAAFLLAASILLVTFTVVITMSAMSDSSLRGWGLLVIMAYMFLMLCIGTYVFVAFIKVIVDFVAELRPSATAIQPQPDDDQEVIDAWHQLGEVGVMTTQYDEVYRDDEDDEIYLYLYVGTARLDYKLLWSDETDCWEIYDYNGDQDRLISVDEVKQLRAQLQQLETAAFRPATA